MSSAGIEPVRYETLPWQPVGDLDLLSRRRRAMIPGEYRAAVPAQIGGSRPSVPSWLAAELDDASAAIVRLDAELGSPRAGEIAPLATVLLRSESAASSRIENLTVGARQLALAELGAEASRNALEVAGNVAAMEAAVALAGGLDEHSILVMHEALMRVHDPATAGRWRTQQVWIGTSSDSPAGAEFVPPHHSRIEAAMRDLVEFLARDDLPVLLQAALAHAQFETVHPFADGNGRTGRALLHALLKGKGLATRLTVPISAGLLTDTSGYFAALGSYRDGDVVPIVDQVARAALRAVGHGRWLSERLAEVKDGWLASMRFRTGSAGRRLIDVLVGQPAVNLRFVEQELDVSQTAARRAIDQLTAAGVLSEGTDRRRNRVWIARDVVEALDDFALRAGRRGPS
ncbi:MAG: Fic family protein [Micropruina sp.]